MVCSGSEHNEQVLCPHCDLLVALPSLSVNSKASCPRCHTTLTMRWKEPQKRQFGYAFSALFMLVLSNLFPFVNMDVAGIYREISLTQIPGVMFADDYRSLAFIFAVFVQFIPAFCLTAILLLSCGIALPKTIKTLLAKNIFLFKTWCMPEIFLVGVLVSFVKLMAYGDIGIGLSFYPFVIFCLLQIRTFQCVDRYELWKTIASVPVLLQKTKTGMTGLSQGLRSCPCCMAILPEEQTECSRCDTYGTARKTGSIQWTVALLLTSIMLYIPANTLPIMITESLGNPEPSTIMSGVVFLWGSGSYPVAMVIFFASIMVPTLKIIAMGWLCFRASGSQHKDSEKMHVIYELVELVGRWSMIDIFVIAVLSSLVRMGRFVGVYPDIASILFAAVVILTMIAAMTFDPRLSWDRREAINERDS